MSRWPTVSLGELCSVTAGGTPARAVSSYFAGSIPWVKIGDMLQGEVSETEETITQSGLENSTAKLLPAGTVLISIFATIGRTAILGVDATTNQAIAGLTPYDPEILLPRYLRRYLDSIVEQLTSQARGVAQVNINSKILKEIEIPLPPPNAQRSVLEILDRSDELRAKRQQAITLLDDLAESTFLHMFNSHYSEAPISLGDHLTFITSGGRGWATYYSDAGSRFIRSLDVRMNEISHKDTVYVTAPNNAEAKRTKVKSGDVLLTITGSLIGRVAPVFSNLEGSYISQHVAILRPDATILDPGFLSFFLSLPDGGQRQISQLQYGQTKPGLNFEQIRAMKIPFPPIELQQSFQKKLRMIKSLAASHREQLAILDALFASLQARAFRNEL